MTCSGLTDAYRSSVRTTWLPDLTARPVSAKPAHASNRFAIWRIAPSGFVARYCKRLSLSLVKSRSFFRPEKKQTQDFGLLRFLADSLLANRSAFVCVIVFNIHHPSSNSPSAQLRREQFQVVRLRRSRDLSAPESIV